MLFFGENMTTAKNGDSVKIHYTGTLEDGTTFDSSAGRDPLKFTLGGGQVIVGFNEAVTGMEVGEKKNVIIPADKAYGQRNEKMVIIALKDQIPSDFTPEIGQQVEMDGENNEKIVARIIEITDKEIILDANPPLAGKELAFDIELVAIG